MAHHDDTDRSIPWIARMLLDTGPAGVALLEGPDFVCTYVNASFQAMAPSRAMLGRPVARVWPEIASRVVPALQQARDTGHPLEAMEWRLDVARNGATEAAWFTFLFHPLPARPGEPAPVAVHAIDRTGAVLARARGEELRAGRERLLEVERTARAAEQLAEAIPQIVWTTDAQGQANWFNRHFAEYTGLGADAGRGPGWLGAVHPDDAPRAAERWAASVASAEPYEIEHRLRRADGVYRWHLTRAAPLRSSDGQVVKWFGTSTDIDDQKRAQEEVQAAREQREDMLRTISHDLRTPLTVVAAQAQMLERRPEERQTVVRRAGTIRTSAARMSAMIDDLVDVVRLEAGNVRIEPRPLDLAAFARELRERLRGALAMERLRLELPEALPRLLADPPRLERILVNLVTNALKYSPPDAEVLLAAEERDGGIRISVRDRGVGIAADELPRLFERFYRAPSATQQEGLGLGLYITRLLVEAHGGRIAAESEPGRGSVFHVTLPAVAR
ncbi:MAG TPA: ATP-binding protein [Anaeromyxobacteraceae bacterium]|nr:ATP-binding protein [Anaeromyxobacteraceae bacterium]